MSQFKCRRCKNTFKHKKDMLRHAELSCRFSSKSEDFKCKACNKTFSRKDSLMRHINTGKCPSKLQKKDQIVSFTTDGIDNLNNRDLEEILNSEYGVIEALVKNVNLNLLKPRHHNIYYSNMTLPIGKVYENGSWIIREINEIIDKLIDAKVDDLKKIKETNEMDEKKIAKINEAINYANYMTQNSRKKLRKFIKIELYKNRKLVAATKKSKLQKDDCIVKEKTYTSLVKNVSRLERKVAALEKRLAKAEVE